jgi:transitional endoplasmic reticulum ATPase
MIVRAIANEVNAAFYSVKGSDVLSKWVGESEQNIASLFYEAKKQPLSIIFIDEVESMFRTRGEDRHNDQRVTEFLQHIDGFSGSSENVLLIGATNRPDDLDYAVMRPGRFSEHIYIPLPSRKSRQLLLRKLLEKVPCDQSIDVDQIAELTKNYSGADLTQLIEKSKEYPLLKYIESNIKSNLKHEDILQALKTVSASTDEKQIEYFEKYNASHN